MLQVPKMRIVFPTQRFEDQVDDNGNGDESDYFDEDEIDMGDNCGGDDEDNDDDELASCLSFFCCVSLLCLLPCCVLFVFRLSAILVSVLV